MRRRASGDGGACPPAALPGDQPRLCTVARVGRGQVAIPVSLASADARADGQVPRPCPLRGRRRWHLRAQTGADGFKVDYGQCFRVLSNPNITVHFNTEAMDVVGNDKGQMSGIQLKSIDTGEESVLEVKGLFYGIGHTPNSHLLQGQIELDSAGYILVQEGSAETSVDGVFAASNVQLK